jgi:hypothetical protein
VRCPSKCQRSAVQSLPDPFAPFPQSARRPIYVLSALLQEELRADVRVDGVWNETEDGEEEGEDFGGCLDALEHDEPTEYIQLINGELISF